MEKDLKKISYYKMGSIDTMSMKRHFMLFYCVLFLKVSSDLYVKSIYSNKVRIVGKNDDDYMAVNYIFWRRHEGLVPEALIKTIFR